MSRHIVSVIVTWLILSAFGLLILLTPLFPTVGSESAEEFDGIFEFLLWVGIPVFMFVVTMVGYSIFMFRAKGDPEDDGPAQHGRGTLPKIWLGATAILAVVVMIHPGLTGLAHLQADSGGKGWGDPNAEIEVDVLAFQFSWSMTYVNENVNVVGAGAELVLPVDRRVKFNVDSVDVVHSFWVPAWRLKIDAIPGRTTFFSVVPHTLGEYETDVAFRVQCAELCGADHGLMYFPVRVVEQAEYDAWIAARQGQ